MGGNNKRKIKNNKSFYFIYSISSLFFLMYIGDNRNYIERNTLELEKLVNQLMGGLLFCHRRMRTYQPPKRQKREGKRKINIK